MKNYFLFQLKCRSSVFYQKINLLIKHSVCYYYSDWFYETKPNNNPVLIEKSYLKKIKRYNKAISLLLSKFSVSDLEKTFNWLCDEYSKEVFIMYVVYLIEHRSYSDRSKPLLRLPLFYSKILWNMEDYNSLIEGNDTITTWHNIGGIELKKYNLKNLGINLNIYSVAGGIFIEFILQQYRYQNINIGENDNVIDCGACWGEASLFFATKTKGKVFAFEFIAENLSVLKKNIELNPVYKNQIEIIEKPLGKQSNETLYAIANGPGSSISSNKLENSIEYKTISIDDYVEQNDIDKIDFIKIDTEGAEEDILRGAIKTIKRFKPKLAVCGYHKIDDLTVLPKLIKEILPDYKLYFDHHTISKNECVFFATI